MKRKGAAIVQRNGSWYGVTLTVREKEITDLEILEEGSLAELEKGPQRGRLRRRG